MRVSWDSGERIYSQGVYNGVLYPKNSPGVPWSGLISVTDKADPSPTSRYVDGRRYASHISPSVFAGTISAYTYPDEWDRHIGLAAGISSQPKQSFGLSFRDNRDIHLIYNAVASPSSDQYSTIGGDVSPIAFSWDIATVPVEVYSARPTSHLVISTDYAKPEAIAELEDLIYGSDSDDPSLPNPAVVLEIFESNTTLRITDNGDGTWTADGPDSAITMLDAYTFQIDWPSATFIDADTYRIYSL
jgi:hypothetical protein